MLRYFFILFIAIGFCSCGSNVEQDSQLVMQYLQSTLHNQLRICEKENQKLQEAMKYMLINDPVKVAPFKRKADSIEIHTKNMLGRIEVVNKGNPLNVTTEELNSDLNNFHVFILRSLPERDRSSFETDKLHVLDIEPNTLLQMQCHVKMISTRAVQMLYRNIDICGFRFDTMAVQVVAESKMVYEGDLYKANIFVTAFSHTANPRIYIGESADGFHMKGKFDSARVEKGRGYYSFTTTSAGHFNFQGVVQLRDPVEPGMFMSYPFSAPYEVIK